MRASILTAAAILLLIVTALLAITPGVADDAANQRLDDLETRVAALETQVAAPPEAATESSSSQQSNSSSSSTTSSNNAYTGSFSGSGDRDIELEIDTAGTYQVTATASAAFSAVLENQAGAVAPDFPIETEGPDTVTVSVSLKPGTYILRVSSQESWNVTLVLLDG